MNPRTVISGLLPFQGSPFNHLGTSPHYSKRLISLPMKLGERREWDSNPCALADKRFSRPPRYSHFDTSPKPFRAALFCSARLIYHPTDRMSTLFFIFMSKIFTIFYVFLLLWVLAFWNYYEHVSCAFPLFD